MLHPHHPRDVDGDGHPSPPAAQRPRVRSRAWACLAAALLAVAGLALASGPPTAAETVQDEGIEVLGHIGGASYAIASDAGRTFAATGAAIHVFDAGPGQRPREVGRPLVLPGLIIDMQTADGHLFVVTTNNDGFWIADASDPGGPHIVGSAGDLVNPQRVFAADGLAYVLDLGDSAATDDQALVIFDVSAPSQPRAVGRLRLPDVGRTSLLDVVVASELAYVALECSSGAECPDLHTPVIDVSDPARPVQVARFDGGARAIAAGDQHVYVGGTDALEVYDAADVSAPARVASLPSDCRYTGLSLVGERLHASRWNCHVDEDLTVLDVSDPADPRPIARATIPDTIGARALSVDGDNVHLAQYWHGYWMVDLADLERPRVVDVTQLGPWHTTSGVDLGASHAFVLTEVRDVRALWLADPTRPRPVGIGRAASLGGSIDVAGQWAYASGATRIGVLDISDPRQPDNGSGYWWWGRQTSDQPNPGHCYRLRGAEDRIYAACRPSDSDPWRPVPVGEGRLTVLDTSDLRNIERVADFDTPGWTYDVEPVADLAYVADGEAGLQVVDVSDPSALRVVGGVETPGTATAITIEDGLAYVADGIAGGLAIVDVGDPAAPRVLGSATTAGQAFDVAVTGSRALVLDFEGTLWVFDVSDPSAPRVATSVDLPDQATHVAAHYSDVYVTTVSGGLVAYRLAGLQPPPTATGRTPTSTATTRASTSTPTRAPTDPPPTATATPVTFRAHLPVLMRRYDVADLPPVPTAIPPAGGRARPYLPNGTLDVLAYDIDLTVPFLPPSVVDASVTVRLRAVEPRAFIDLDVDPETIDVKRVARAGTALPFEVVEGPNATSRLPDAQLRIHLDAPLAEGDETELTIDYMIRQAIFGETPGLYYTHDFHGSQVLAAFNWPYYARRWLPSNDHPSDAATFTFDLRVPPDAIGAANGALLEGDYAVGSGVGEDGLRLFRWSHEQPIPTYATSIVVGTLNVAHEDVCFNTDDAGGEIVDCEGAQHSVPVVFYAPPDVPLRAQFDADLDAAARAVVYLSSTLGAYPYAKVGFTVSDHALFAMEYASLIAFARNTPGLAVHEVTHSWWGNSVRIGHWGDFWLSEGFTTYFSNLVREHESGEVTFQPNRSGRMVYPPGTDPFVIYFESSAPYTKGASAVHDLRARLADAAGLAIEDAAAKALFTAVARDLYETYRYETLSSSSLLAFLRANLGRHLAAHGHTVADAEIEALVAGWAEAWYVSADTTVGAHWDGGGADLRAFDGDPDWLPQIIDVGPITERLAWFGLACNNEDGSPPAPEQDVAGKVALVERGSCSFNEKLSNVSDGGARAVVMFTDERLKVHMACVPTETLTCDAPLDLPAVMIDQTSGQALRDRLLAGTTVTVTLSSQRYDPMAP